MTSRLYYDIATGPDGRPPLHARRTYDVDTAHHFLADHADRLVVAFDHHAMAPQVVIYVVTPEGALSAGDYYLWPLLHRTGERIQRELEQASEGENRLWYDDRRRLGKWRRSMVLLTTLIRIRKAAIQALCAWDLTGRRPAALTVVDTAGDLTGLTPEEAVAAGRVNVPSAGPAP